MLSLSGGPGFPGYRPCTSLEPTKHESFKSIPDGTAQRSELSALTPAFSGFCDTVAEHSSWMKGQPRIFVSSDPNPGKMQSLSSPRPPLPSPPQAFALPEDSKENPGTKGVTLRQALPR